MIRGKRPQPRLSGGFDWFSLVFLSHRPSGRRIYQPVCYRRRESPPATRKSVPSLRGGQTRSPFSARLRGLVFSPYCFPGLPKGTLKCDGTLLSWLAARFLCWLSACRRPRGLLRRRRRRRRRARSRSSCASRSTANIPRGQARRACSARCSPRWPPSMRRMDAAAADKDVSAVWLKIEDLAIGRGKDLRVARRDRPAAQGRQAGLCRTDHRRQRPVSAGRGLRPDRHAALRHVDHARRAGGSHLLQGPAGQARARSSTSCKWASTRAPPSR